jgi:hypothetical protein
VEKQANNCLDDKYFDICMNYRMARFLFSKSGVDIHSLMDYIRSSYPEYSHYKSGQLTNIIGKTFKYYSTSKTVLLTDEQIEALQYIDRSHDYSFEEDIETIVSEIERLNARGFTPFSKWLLMSYLNSQYQDSMEKSCILKSLFFDTFSNMKTNYRIIDQLFTKGQKVVTRDLESIVIYQDILDILFSIGVDSVERLLSMNPYAIILLFNQRIESFYFYFQYDNRSLPEQIKTLLRDGYSRLAADDYDILISRRNPRTRSQSLQEIGIRYSVTRERIRQKEKKTLKTIMSHFQPKKEILLNYAEILFNKYGSKIIEYNTIERELGAHAPEYLIIMSEFRSTNIHFDQEHCLIYQGRSEDYVRFITGIIRDLPDAITKERIDAKIDQYDRNMQNLIKHVIKKEYRLFGDVHLKNKVRISQLILSAVDELFPRGFRISSESQLKQLHDYFANNYGPLCKEITKRKVETAFSNHGYRLVDKGTYINPVFLPELSFGLLNRIIQFINLRGGNVYYTVIYETFIDELNREGIDNRFLLKGVLDPKIESSFYTKRDYIKITADGHPYDPIYRFIDDQEGIFSLDDLRREFPGLQLNIFHNLLYLRDDILWLEHHRFVTKRNADVPNGFVELLQEVIEDTFSNLGQNQITSKKVFAIINIKHPEILRNIGMIRSHHDLFSFMRVFLANDYHYSRPFISKEENTKNYYELILKYAYSHVRINKQIMDRFTDKMHLRRIYNYLEFMEALATDYVQYDMDSMVKRSELELSEEQLAGIDKSLNLILRNRDLIDTRSFKGYYLFPRLGPVWNKYLLAGIVRSFFEEQYEVGTTNNTYSQTDFIIRRYKND